MSAIYAGIGRNGMNNAALVGVFILFVIFALASNLYVIKISYGITNSALIALGISAADSVNRKLLVEMLASVSLSVVGIGLTALGTGLDNGVSVIAGLTVKLIGILVIVA